jgi:hypothetical protein
MEQQTATSDNHQPWYGIGWWKKFFCEMKVGDIAIAYFTFCLVVVGGFQAYWMARTLKVSESAARAAEKSADAVVSQLRAYVHWTEAAIHSLDQPVSQVHLVLKNSGQTPAYDCVDWMGVKVTQFPLAVELLPPEPGSISTSKSSIGPGVSYNLVREICLPDEIKAALREGTMAIYVFGEIRYRDAFKIDRFTRYRLIYGGDAGARPEGALANAPEGNDSN